MKITFRLVKTGKKTWNIEKKGLFSWSYVQSYIKLGDHKFTMPAEFTSKSDALTYLKSLTKKKKKDDTTYVQYPTIRYLVSDYKPS
jgi:hypothetical protein